MTGMNALLGEAKKTIPRRYFQLKVGHALTGVYLERIKKNESQECWWCGHKRQTRDHLFKWCKKMEAAAGWPLEGVEGQVQVEGENEGPYVAGI